jgi:hypothetical protein
MTPLRTIALATAVALPLGVLISQVVPRWRGDPVKVCILFLDGLMRGNENPTIWPHELDQELVARGVTLPSRPSLTFGPSSSGREAEARLREYESAKKAYEAKWDEVKASAEYQRAREAVLNRNRDKALRVLRNCLVREVGEFE